MWLVETGNGDACWRRVRNDIEVRMLLAPTDRHGTAARISGAITFVGPWNRDMPAVARLDRRIGMLPMGFAVRIAIVARVSDHPAETHRRGGDERPYGHQDGE
jgi:hypothetical protein